MNEIVTAPSTTSELGENRKGDPTAPKSQALVKKLKDFISEKCIPARMISLAVLAEWMEMAVISQRASTKLEEGNGAVRLRRYSDLLQEIIRNRY